MDEKRRGRPRSERARTAVLGATRELIETTGYDAMTMEGIATRAGVGKQTIYRWWPGKAAVVGEAVLGGHIPLVPVDLDDSGDIYSDLRDWLHQLAEGMADPTQASLIRALAAAVSGDEQVSRGLYDHSTGPYRQAIVARLREGVAAGDVRPDADLTAVADAMIGMLLFLVLARQEIATARVDGLLDVLLSGIVN